MTALTRYIHTSVSDAKISLEGDVRRDPHNTALTALALLEELQGQDGQASRRKMLASIVRQAAKAIANDTTRDPEGPRAGDTFAELGLADLRPLLNRMLANAPANLAREALATLVSLRTEEGMKTRRQTLVTAIGHAAKALLEDPAADCRNAAD